MDGVHVVDEGFHRLVNARHGAVDGMLLDACIAFQSVEWAFDVVVYLGLVQVLEVVTIEIFQIFHLFYIRGAHEGGEIEVEGRDGLSTVHLVLCALQGDARQHGGCLDALGWSGRAVSSGEPMLQDVIQWVLAAGERLGGVVVFVVYVQQIVCHRLTTLF